MLEKILEYVTRTGYLDVNKQYGGLQYAWKVQTSNCWDISK